jgi:NADPH-dependent curcumin reductase CurA
MKNRRFVLAARPVGMVQPSDFRYEEAPIPEPSDGEVLVRNLFLSLDPAMRGWITDRPSYIPPVKLNEVMRGGTISEVIESRHPDFKPGDRLRAMGGWQDYAALKPDLRSGVLPEGLGVPLTAHLSVLGITGLTAYFGLLEVGRPQAGETVVVSTAAGAVGSIVGQIAKLKGCRVVGIAGTAEKCAWIRDTLGFDAAINYRTESVFEALRAACPEGIDVYFDNVGGDILNMALALIRRRARVVICGAITQYNATSLPPGPSNYLNLLVRSARMEGFIVMDFLHKAPEAVAELAQWVLSGRLKYKEEIVEGLEKAPLALLKLFDGSNSGKLIVKIA